MLVHGGQDSLDASKLSDLDLVQTVCCLAWRLIDNQACHARPLHGSRHARPLHGSQAQMLMLLELLLELLLLLLLYVFNHVLLRGREAPP